MPTCFYHTDRETGRSCTRCGRPACPECLHQAAVGSHCWECISAAQPPRAEQVQRALRSQTLVVTRVIIAANIGLFVLSTVQGASLGGGGALSRFQIDYGTFGPAVATGEWWRLFSSAFVHFGVIHIAFNMLILWRLGEMMEEGIGRRRFLALFVVSVLTSSCAEILATPFALSGGASGAVFGLAAAATVGLRQRGVRFYDTGWGPLLLLNLFLGLFVPNISVAGHVGGMIGGGLVGAVLIRPNATTRDAAAGYLLALALSVAAVALALWASHQPSPVL